VLPVSQHFPCYFFPWLLFSLGEVVTIELTTQKLYYTNIAETLATPNCLSRQEPHYAGYAEVAELVDALGSGSSGRTPVGVRVPASAPFFLKGLRKFSNPFFLRERLLSKKFIHQAGANEYNKKYFLWRQRPPSRTSRHAPVAQLDRATDF
jgi:hypothetical protein